MQDCARWDRALSYAKEKGLIVAESYVVLTTGLLPSGSETNLLSVIKVT